MADETRQNKRSRSAATRVRAKTFPPALRGYDRAAVDAWREETAELVERLESQAPRHAAVKRALDEVGAETSSILQRAHEAADEISSRSRSQAEGRLQRAEREAEVTISEAEARAEQLEADAQAIWQERSRLLEEMRQLADEVLGVADDAAERLQSPQPRVNPAAEAEVELPAEEAVTDETDAAPVDSAVDPVAEPQPDGTAPRE
jgi:DivIVA domain-containing protein